MKKNLFVCLTLAAMLLFGGTVMAQPDFPGPGYNPGNGNYVNLNGNAFWKQGGGDDNPCSGPDCSVEGNFNASVFAIGGAPSFDLEFIPNGVAGGIGLAGGVAGAQAEGAFESFTFGRRHPVTFTLGGAEANIGVTAGGLTKTEAYDFYPGIGDLSIGVGSYTSNIAAVHGYVDGNAWGLAFSEACFAGIGGQASLDASMLFDSPLPMWTSHGVTGGVAGQGSLGLIYGGGIAAGFGSYEAEAGIDMVGGSQSESYRAIDFFSGGKTEIMGTNVKAFTSVVSYGDNDDHFIGTSFVGGGWVAGGVAAAKTVQFTQTGLAKATTYGSYSGAGELGCGMNASATGYTMTKATTLNGYNGSIMSSSAGMKVQNVPNVQ